MRSDGTGAPVMKLRFDRGTIVLADPPNGLNLAAARESSGTVACARIARPPAGMRPSSAGSSRPPFESRTSRRVLDPSIDGSQLVVVGDSEHDVLCGRSIKARAVAVCTGWTSVTVLRALRPHALLADLSDTPRALAAILGAPGA